MKKLSISKLFAFVVAVSSGLASTGFSAEEFYVATLSGVECDGCKKTIAKSLAKLDGVEEIRIEKLGDEKHRMTVTTDGSVEISEEQAVAAIAHAEHYKIQSWSKSSKAPAPAHHHQVPIEETKSWLEANGWESLVGTWQEGEDGLTTSFTWKFPGRVLESFTKWGESEKYSILWHHPETGEIHILSTDNRGGHSMGTCTFGPDKAVFADSYVSSDKRTGSKTAEYVLEGDTLKFRINDGEYRILKRK